MRNKRIELYATVPPPRPGDRPGTVGLLRGYFLTNCFRNAARNSCCATKPADRAGVFASTEPSLRCVRIGSKSQAEGQMRADWLQWLTGQLADWLTG
eukprot:1181553-Prorocentrum_minimum.AAC.2